MTWRRSGDKPLSKPMVVSLLTYLYGSLGLNESIQYITSTSFVIIPIDGRILFKTDPITSSVSGPYKSGTYSMNYSSIFFIHWTIFGCCNFIHLLEIQHDWLIDWLTISNRQRWSLSDTICRGVIQATRYPGESLDGPQTNEHISLSKLKTFLDIADEKTNKETRNFIMRQCPT